MKLKKRAYIFLFSLIFFYVLARYILPTDENGKLVWVQWYRPIIVFGPFLIAIFYDKFHFPKKSTKKDSRNNMAESKNGKNRGCETIAKYQGSNFVEPGKEIIYVSDAPRIDFLTTKIQQAAKIVSETTKPDEFFDCLNYLLDCLLDLQRYEKYEDFGRPAPSEYYVALLDQLELTVDLFVTRAVEKECKERAKISDPQESYSHHEKFLIALISAFDCANTFWSGDKISPHYIGPLFTKENYARVQVMYNKLDDEYDNLILIPKLQKSIEEEKISEPNINISSHEKEVLKVQHVRTEDMLQFTGIPYDMNCPVQKSLQDGGHPLAYMDLNSYNVKIAKSHLKQLDEIIDSHRKEIPLLEKRYFIDVGKIAFSAYSSSYGYTKLICEPYTFSGSVSKFPVKLTFMSRLDRRSYMVNGSISYDENGNIANAEVSISHESGSFSGGTMWLFNFCTVLDNLVLWQAKTTLAPDEKGLPSAVYKDKTLIESELERERDMQIFKWIQENLPALCPKSLSGFRRMRSMNSKNYQKIVAEAAKLGNQI